MANFTAPTKHDECYFSRLNLDVLKNICDMIVETSIEGEIVKGFFDGISRTNHLLRELSLPVLFRTITISGSWDNAFKRLTARHDCAAFSRYIRIFKFNVFMADKEQVPPENLPSALARRFLQMPQLQKLVLVIPEHYTDIFAKAISEFNIVLPAVHTLVIGPFCDFAVQMCPNVTTIANNGWSALHALRGDKPPLQHTCDLIVAAGSARKLESLEIMAWWRVDFVMAIHDSVPHLKKLALDAGSYKKGIKSFLPALSRLTDLEYLALGAASKLDVGFYPPRCGNAYKGPRGKEVRERVNLDCQVAERTVAAMVATVCPRLKDLWIGDSTHVEVLRDKDGVFENYVMHRDLNRKKVVQYPRP